MPGFDGTGPRGEGPMTGGARGPCNPASRAVGGAYRAPYPGTARSFRGVPATSRPRWGLRGFRGRGFRGGAGRGRGRGRR